MRNVQRLIWILWPSFIVGGVATGVFFTLFDPFDLHFFGTRLEISREAMYTMGFFGFWLLALTSSALTLLLEGTLWGAGQPPESRADRPAGCPMADMACLEATRLFQPAILINWRAVAIAPEETMTIS